MTLSQQTEDTVLYRYKPPAIQCDIDGTIAEHHRSPYEYDRLHTDTLIVPIADILHEYCKLGYRIILLSGRPNSHAYDTIAWLSENGVSYDELWMRQAADNRRDDIIKEELYREHVEPFYDIQFVLDDRNRVVNMWRRIGLTCLQVAPGDF